MKFSKSKARGKAAPRRVAKLYPASDEARQWSTLLETELLTWPRVQAKPMFGFRSFYRGKRIFAALPRTKAFDQVGSLLLKFETMPAPLQKKAAIDPRIGAWSRISGRGWITFTLNSGEDLRDALWWLNQACTATLKAKSR